MSDNKCLNQLTTSNVEGQRASKDHGPEDVPFEEVDEVDNAQDLNKKQRYAHDHNFWISFK